MKYLFYVALIIGLSVTTTDALCQDSLIVCVTRGGRFGEKFKIHYKDQEILRYKSKDQSIRKFKIPIEDHFKYGTTIAIFVYRKGLFGLLYSRPVFPIYYEEGYKYLIIYRDNLRRKKFAFNYKWSNEAPL